MIDTIIIIVIIIIVVTLCTNYFSKSTEHLTSISNEGLQDLGSVYNTSNLTAPNLTVTGTTTCTGEVVTNGPFTANGVVTVNNTVAINKPITMNSDVTTNANLNSNGNLNVQTIVGRTSQTGDIGRLHISGNELLYLLNKSGVIVGKDWGGNGNLTVQGILSAPYSVPGAWFIDTGNATVPIFGNISNMTNLGGWSINDADDVWIVQPGYKLIIYTEANYSGNAYTSDNTTGTKPTVFLSKNVKIDGKNDTLGANKISSLKLFLKGVEMPWY